MSITSSPAASSAPSARRRTEATRVPSPPSEPPGLLRRGVPAWAIVLLASISGFMVVMDTSIVNVALPSMRGALHLTGADQQWVIDAYLLTLGGFMLLGARAGDLYGYRRVLAVGITVFVLGSLSGGLARDATMLLVSRAVQGLGGAVLSPAGLALIIATHPDGAARSKAITIYQGASAVAVTIGVLIGGLLTQELSWRWVMFINVPVGIGLLVAVARLLDPEHHGRAGERLDAAGAVTVTVAIGALIEGLANAQQHSWGSIQTLGCLAGGAALLAAFIAIETRVSQPLVRLSIFRLSGITPGTLVLALNGTVLTASTFFVSLVLQSDLGEGALTAGVALMPLVLASTVAAFASMKLTARIQPRLVIMAGLVTAAGGFLWLGLLGSHPGYAADILGPLIVIGTGLGIAVVRATRAAAAAVPPRDAGLASGLFSISRQLGSAIGIAALVTLAVAQSRSHAARGAGAAASALHGDAAALLACAGVCLLSALVALLLPRRAESTD